METSPELFYRPVSLPLDQATENYYLGAEKCLANLHYTSVVISFESADPHHVPAGCRSEPREEVVVGPLSFQIETAFRIHVVS